MKFQMKIGLIMIACSLVITVWVLAGGVGKADDVPAPASDIIYNNDGLAYDGGSLVQVSENADPTVTLGAECTDIASGAFAGANNTTAVVIYGEPNIAPDAFVGGSVTTVYCNSQATIDAYGTIDGISFIYQGGVVPEDPGQVDPPHEDPVPDDPTPDNPIPDDPIPDNPVPDNPAPAPAPEPVYDPGDYDEPDPAPAPAPVAAAPIATVDASGDVKTPARTSVSKTASQDLSYANTSSGGYVITSGINSTVLQATTDKVRIVCNGEFSKFVNVEVDNQVIGTENYTATEGSTIIDFEPDYIHTLSSGVHTVKINYNDGYAGTAMVVSSGASHTLDNTPKTSDGLDGRLAFAAAFLMLGIAAMLWSQTNEARLKAAKKRR